MTIEEVARRDVRWPAHTWCAICGGSIEAQSLHRMTHYEDTSCWDEDWDEDEDEEDDEDIKRHPAWMLRTHLACEALRELCPDLEADDEEDGPVDHLHAYLDVHPDPRALIERIEDEGYRAWLLGKYAKLLRHEGQLKLPLDP